MAADDIPTLRRILKTSRTIAVVGLSADWFRPSQFAAKYLQQHGYRVVPGEPALRRAEGARRALPRAGWRTSAWPIDIVDVFRKTADVLPIAERRSRSAPSACGSSSA